MRKGKQLPNWQLGHVETTLPRKMHYFNVDL